MFSAALALAAALASGASDYVCGTTSRRAGTLQCLLAFFSLSLALSVLWVVISGDRAPDLPAVAAALGTGLATVVAVGAFMRAMVIGTISIVAPIGATGVIVPIAVGISRGQQPNWIQLIGIITAIAGVMLAVRSSRDDVLAPARDEAGIGFAILAAVAFGLVYWLIAPASQGGVSWAAMLAMGVAVVVCGVAARLRRTPMRTVFEGRNLRDTLCAALLGLGGFALYGFATRHGKLPIVSVLASLFPVVTVSLAYFHLGERVRHAQQLGIGIVVAGVVLMTVG